MWRGGGGGVGGGGGGGVGGGGRGEGGGGERGEGCREIRKRGRDGERWRRGTCKREGWMRENGEEREKDG